MVVVENFIESAAEKFLTGEHEVNDFEVRRDLSEVVETPQMDFESFTRVLQGIPTGCIIVNEGNSDEKCVTLGQGRFSYKCGQQKGYLCCNDKQGKKIETGGIIGKCTRNTASDVDVVDLDGVQFDPAVTKIRAEATEIDCARYDYEASPDNKCVLVVLTLAGPDNDLREYEEILESAVEKSAFQTQVNIDGLRAMVMMFDATERPTAQPTNRPSRNPTIRPTTAPITDPCPRLSGNCTKCVMNDECLWCRGNGVCFNSDPVVRGGGGTGAGGVSRLRFLEEEDEVCVGTVTSSERVCNLPTAPPSTEPPSNDTVCDVFGNGTHFSNGTLCNSTNPNKDSGASLFSAARSSFISAVVVSTILLSLGV